MDQQVLVSPGLDADRSIRLACQQAVQENLVVRGVDTRYQCGVIGPGYGWIDRLHRSRDRAFPGQFAQGWNGQPRILKSIGGKSIQADDHNYSLRLLRRMCGAAEKSKSQECGK